MNVIVAEPARVQFIGLSVLTKCDYQHTHAWGGISYTWAAQYEICRPNPGVRTCTPPP